MVFSGNQSSDITNINVIRNYKNYNNLWVPNCKAMIVRAYIGSEVRSSRMRDDWPG